MCTQSGRDDTEVLVLDFNLHLKRTLGMEN